MTPTLIAIGLCPPGGCAASPGTWIALIGCLALFVAMSRKVGRANRST